MESQLFPGVRADLVRATEVLDDIPEMVQDPRLGERTRYEEEYKVLFARALYHEFKAARKEREAEAYFADPQNRRGLLDDLYAEAIGLTREQQVAAMEALGVIWERMQADRFHVEKIRDTLRSAWGLMFNMAREDRLRNHPNAEKPRCRSRKGAQLYAARHIAERGGDKKKKTA